MRKRNRIILVFSVTALTLVFLAGEKSALHAGLATRSAFLAANMSGPASAAAQTQSQSQTASGQDKAKQAQTPPPDKTPQQEKAAPAEGTKEVVFGKLQPYVHKSGLFTVSFPDNWTIKDQGTADEVIVVASDPTENGIIILRCHAAAEMTELELSNALVEFVRGHMSNLDGFTLGDPIPQADGGFHIIFRYTQTVNGKDFRMYGETFVQQHNGYAATAMILIPQEQYSAKSKLVYEITNSFHLTGKK